MNGVLELRGVRRTYRTAGGDVPALRDVDLVVQRGELIALVGPSGSGKSTLLHVAIGWEIPDAGHVHRALEVDATPGWGGLALVPQDLGLLEELTAAQNVDIAADLAGRRDVRHARSISSALGLDELLDRRPAELSLGEQQRVAIARALGASPLLLIADEPTAHQDEANASGIMALLSEVADAGAGVLVATHDHRMLGQADRVVEMVDGRLVSA